MTVPSPTDPDPRENARLGIVLLTVGVSVAWVSAVAGRPWSDGRTAALLSFVNLTLFLAHVLRHRDAAVARLLLFGLGLGVVELIADALCVRYTGTLDYAPARSAMLGLSPWWMPLAWMLVAAQIGYLGARLIERLGVARGALLGALIGAVNIPFYEEMAYHAHWWRYVDCRRVGHTPVYIIVAELVIGLALGPLARVALRRPSARTALLAGALGGVATIIGGLVGYGLIERVLPWLAGERPALLP